MPIEECRHCIEKVMFSKDGKCPSCGNSKFMAPLQSRDQIIYDQEKEKLKDQLNYTSIRSFSLIIGSGLLFLSSTVITIWTTLKSDLIVWWYGGIIAGFLGIISGFKILKVKKDLKKILTEKYSI